MNFLFLAFAIIAGGGLLAYLKAPLSIATAASGIGLLVLSNSAGQTLMGLADGVLRPVNGRCMAYLDGNVVA